MSKITRLVKAKTQEKRVKVYLDGRYACTLLAEVVLRDGLKVGREVTEERLAALNDKNQYQRSLNTAARLLGYRPRSEAEIRQHLQRRGFDSESTVKALAYLKEQGLIDDAAFAKYWVENRETFRPRSRRLAGLELRRKGLKREIIEQVIGEIDESESAYRAAQSKMRHLSPKDYDDFRKRLGSYLARRGFNYEVIGSIVARAWKERGKQTASV
ncbi:MAG TPA: regulatory protein RecX [Dehalococcoidales bacterium]|nr:regulatory protein RecX [Dehalococcoidales bacterium]